MYEAGEMMERLSELGESGTTLQQAIDQKLAEMEHFVTEIGDIESEVKIIESKLSKINTILSSVTLCDLPILEHLENRQIILENLEEMKDLVGVMEECKESLGLPEEVVCTVEAFTKVAQLTVELTHLQELTTQQSTMLQSLSEKLQEYDTTMERLQEGCEFSIEVQCEKLADLTKQKELLLNNTQEALTRLVQEEQACEQPVDEGCTEEEQPFTAHNNQPRDSQVFPDGKLPSLMEEDEDNEEDENTIESAERRQTPVPLPDSFPALLEDLHVYRERAAALERWLDTAPESLGGSGCDQEMQRVVEEHLLQSQRMLLEIEQKVCELAKAGQKGGSTVQPELESLSLRLRTLKDTLVNYQAKLQSEAQGAHTKEIAPANETTSLLLPSGQLTSPVTKPRLSRQDSLQQQKELEMELTEHKQLTEYIARHADRMWQQNQGPNREEQEPARPTSKDSGDILPLGNVMPAELRVPGEVPANHVTWQHLQRETEGHLRLLEDSLRQGLGSQVTVTARSLHRARGISSASPLAAEELNSWLTQLQELGREAAAIATQGEGHINEAECLKLEKSMQNATRWISHWLDAVEEGMCSDSSIHIEEAEQELRDHQLLSDTLERVCRELSEQRYLLGQSDVFGDQICPVALECLGNLQHRLKLLQSFHSTVSQSLRDGARQITQYQVRLRQLEAALLQRRTDAQKRLVESVGHSTGEQLQLIEEMECGLESLEEQLLALIAEGEQYDLEPSATQDICRLEEVLDDTRMCLREQQREVRQRLVLASQYECLVQGLSGLVDSGQEKVTREASPLTKSIGDLRSHLQNYKHFFRSLANHLILLEQFSQNIPESIVARNRDFRLKLVEEVTALQSQALLHGVQMETTLQAWTEFEVDYSFLMKEVEMLNSAVPSVELVEETEERLAERVGTFQRIRKSLDGNQPRVDQALRNGRLS
ncbi:nesprin-2-like [Heterodontus francisci]|uniref:nesprin-2-like n=1 Tax=Heterodontus francisci TaxID=7792 RepID=UPI00355B7842